MDMERGLQSGIVDQLSGCAAIGSIGDEGCGLFGLGFFVAGWSWLRALLSPHLLV